MGLLDNLLYSTNANFGGQNAGLLDMLNTFQMQNSQYQPSAGFQPVVGANQPSPLDTAQYPTGPIGAPSNAMAQAPQGQNPIAVGNYQMPRIGDPSQFASVDDAALPQNAQPTQGQLPPQQPLQAPQITAPTPGVSDRLIAGLQGFANAKGLLPALANGISGIATGQRSDPVGIAQQSANMTARALLAKGVDSAAVQAAITNPELMKTLITQTYGPQTVQSLGNGYVWDPKKGAAVKAYEPDSKKSFVHYKDANGQEIPGIFDPDANDGKGGFTPIATPAAASGPAGSLQEAMKSGVSGEDLYNFLPPDRARTVRAMIEGRMPPPSTTAMRSPATMQLIDAANAIDPSFDATTWKARSTFNTQFGSQAPSSIGGQKVLMSTALGHLAEVANSAAELSNSDGGFTGLAPVGHMWNSAKNTTTKQAAIANALEDKVAKFSGEVGKLYSGSQGGGVHEREDTRNRLGSSLTSAELAAGLEASRDLILSKQKALEDQTAQIFGPERAKKFDFVGPEGRDAIDKIEKAIMKLRGQNGGAEPTAAPPQPAAPPAQTMPDRAAVEAEMKRRGLL